MRSRWLRSWCRGSQAVALVTACLWAVVAAQQGDLPAGHELTLRVVALALLGQFVLLLSLLAIARSTGAGTLAGGAVGGFGTLALFEALTLSPRPGAGEGGWEEALWGCLGGFLVLQGYVWRDLWPRRLRWQFQAAWAFALAGLGVLAAQWLTAAVRGGEVLGWRAALAAGVLAPLAVAGLATRGRFAFSLRDLRSQLGAVAGVVNTGEVLQLAVLIVLLVRAGAGWLLLHLFAWCFGADAARQTVGFDADFWARSLAVLMPAQAALSACLLCVLFHSGARARSVWNLRRLAEGPPPWEVRAPTTLRRRAPDGKWVEEPAPPTPFLCPTCGRYGPGDLAFCEGCGRLRRDELLWLGVLTAVFLGGGVLGLLTAPAAWARALWFLAALFGSLPVLVLCDTGFTAWRNNVRRRGG